MKKILSFLLVVILFFGCKDDEKSSDKKILGFTVNLLQGTINEELKTIAIELPAGADVTSLAPTIKVSDKASVSPESGKTQDFTSPVNYTVTAEDGGKAIYTVTADVKKNEEAKAASFSFESLNPAAIGVINEADKTITVSVLRTTDVADLTPTIVVSQGAAISPVSGAPQDFTDPVTYTVTSESGITTEYTVHVNVIASSHKQITSFVFSTLSPKVEAVINEETKAITATVPYGTAVGLLAPAVTISDDASVLPQSGVASDFTNPVAYTVTADDKSSVAYTVTVVAAPFVTTITNISPLQAAPGAQLTLTGTFAPAGNIVSMEGNHNHPLVVVSQNSTNIVATIPANVVGGDYYISVTSHDVKDRYTGKLVITLPDMEITNATPVAITPGATITISGNNFGVSNNTVHLNGNDGSSYNLTVTAQSTTSITATIPNSIDDGSYTLEVRNENRSVAFGTSVVVTDPTAPRIISVNKTSLVKGIDDLIIIGVNLGTANGYVFIQKKGQSASGHLISILDGTQATFLASGLTDYTIGEYSIWLRINGDDTNKIDITLTANPNPVPQISGISSLTPCRGTDVTITGSNFSANAEVVLDLGNGMISRPAIISKSATEIVFSTDKLYSDMKFTGIEVISMGQKGKHIAAFKVQDCNPEYVSISPAQASQGATVTITGNHFIDAGDYVRVYLGESIDYVMGTVTNDKTITFKVPNDAAYGTTAVVVKSHYTGITYFTIPDTAFKIDLK